MAYVDQAKKTRIASELKKVIPHGWKYSLSVEHHMTIVCTIYAAPAELIKAVKGSEYFNPETATDYNVNPYHFDNAFEGREIQEGINSIMSALNTENHNRSDIQSDYFDVGHYVALNIGRWNKPFICTAATV
jgi:hypothetical protein